MGMPAWERFPLVHGVVGSPGAKTRTVRTLDAAAASGCAFPEDIVLADSGLVSESGWRHLFHLENEIKMKRRLSIRGFLNPELTLQP